MRTRPALSFARGGFALAAVAAAACSSGAAPASSVNLSPVITDTAPTRGMIVDGTAAPPTFTVSVTDPNLGDDLHVRFLADFPPDTANTRALMRDMLINHRSDGKPILQDVSETPSCVVDNLAKIPQHQIMAIVADRPFDDSSPPAGMPADLTKLADPDGHEVIATWTLDLECP